MGKRKITGIVTGYSPVESPECHTATQGVEARRLHLCDSEVVKIDRLQSASRFHMKDGRQQSSSSLNLENPESYWSATWPTLLLTSGKYPTQRG